MAWDDANPTSASTLSTMTQWEALFGELSPSGVVQGAGSELAVSVNSATRTVTIGSGGALVRGFRTGGSSSTDLAAPAADSQARVDRVVARLDRAAATAAAWITPVIIEGSPGSNPQPPSLSRTTAGAWDLPLARYTANANGTLTGLVDERVFIAPALAFKSVGRPTLSGPALGVEADTGRPVYTVNGSSWSPLAEDSGWTSLSMNGEDGAFWADSGSKIRKRNGVVHLRLAIKRWPSSSLDVANDSVPINLATGLRPTSDEAGFAYHGDSVVAISVEADGKVRLYPLATGVPANRTVKGSATFFVD